MSDAPLSGDSPRYPDEMPPGEATVALEQTRPLPGERLDPQTAARAAGYSWQEIDNHVATASTAAVAAGYTQSEIDQHLGYQSPDRMIERARANFAAGMASESSVLDGLYKPVPELSLSSATLPGDYARALADGETKGPLDFASSYAAAALQAAQGMSADEDQSPATVQSWLRAAGVAANEMAMTLPNPRDVTDAALSVGGGFETARQNLLDHWQETGEAPLSAAMRAQTDPALSDKLTAVPEVPQSHFDTLVSGLMSSLTAGALPPDLKGVLPSNLRDAGQMLLDAGSTGFTVGVRGLGSLVDFTADPLAIVRTIVSPTLSKLEADFEPGPGKRLGDLLFRATGIPETAPETATGRVALAAAEGLAAGGPLGVAGAVAGAAAGAAGEATSELTHSDRLAAIASLLAASVVAGVHAHGTAIEAQETARNAFLAQVQALDRLDPRGVPSATEAVLDAVNNVMRRAPVTVVDPSGTTAGEIFRTIPAEDAAKPVQPAAREPAEAPATPPGEGVPEAPGPRSFTTAKGSTYEVHDDGTTTRNKSYHPEHGPEDVGLKARSARTIYVNSAEDASNLSGAGLSGVGPKGFRLVTRDGKATLVWENQNGQWGTAASSRDIPFTTEPDVGKFPVEMWSPKDDVPGFAEAYSNQHGGNAITEVRGGTEAPGPRPFVADATPAEKVEALVQEKIGKPAEGEAAPIEDAGNPNLIADLAKDEDPATQELAKSYDTATSLFEYLRAIVTKTFEDDSGALMLAGQARVKLQGGGEVARDSTLAWYTGASEAERLIRRGMGNRNWFTSHFGAELDRMQVYLNPHMAEFDAAIAAKDIARIKGSVVGHMIRYLQGEPGVTIAKSDKTYAVAMTLRKANQAVHQYISQLAAEGKVTPLSYQKDYFRQMWRDPNETDRWFASRQGDPASWKQKTIPNTMDGIEGGLVPAETNPLRLAMMDIQGKLGFVMTQEMIGEAQKSNWVYYSLKPENTGDIPLVGSLAEKGVPGADPPMTMRAYAHPGFARIYNNAFGMGVHQLPFKAIGNTYDALIFGKNSFLSMKMILPTYHALTISWHVAGGGIAAGLREAGFGLTHGDLGELGRGALDTALSATIVPRVLQGLYVGAQKMDAYIKMANDPVLDRLASVNARFGPRQDIYQTGRAPSYWQAIAHNYRDAQGNAGLLESSKSLARAAWEQIGAETAKEPDMGYLGLRAKILRSGLYELGRFTTSISAPLFDYAVPFLKTFANYSQLEMEMRFNQKRGTPKTDDWLDNRARQIVDNTDDRMGEMNMENVFWNRLLKDAAATTAISTGWVYGTWRQVAAAFGARLSGGRSHVPFRTTWDPNPIALGNVLGLAAVIATVNTVYQELMTGKAPEGFDDLFVGGRTGGLTKGGQPARIQIPGEQKEVFDLSKIVANTYGAAKYGGANWIGAGALELGGGVADYANFKNAWNSFSFLINHGKDAIEHRVAYTPGGVSGAIEKLFEPIISSTAENLRVGSGIPKWQTQLGFKEAPTWAEDWPAFMKGWEDRSNQYTKDELSRATKEAVATGQPIPAGGHISAPRGGGGYRTAPFSTGAPPSHHGHR